MSGNKVLMIGWELPPYNSGGLGVACYGLANALSQKGYDITFLLPKRLDIKADFMKIKFADIKEEDFVSNAYTYSQLFSKVINLGNPNTDFVKSALLFGERVSKMAEKIETDIIHSHDWLTFPAGLAAKKILNKPLVSHIHSTEIDRTGGLNPNKEVFEIEKKGMKDSDRVISVSSFTKSIISDNYGIGLNKIHVVHNGIDMDYSELSPALIPMKELGYKIVLFLGRITLMKGPDYFVKAAKMVLKYEPKTLFVVAGSGDMQGNMINEAIKEGIISNFVFTGFLRGEDKDKIFRAADIYVMPSVSEPFGITTLESVINKTPVLVSKQSGVSEVLKNVLKTDFWDTEEMANKIISVLRHDSLSSDLVSESFKEIPAINWNTAADKCIGVYKQLT